MDRIVTPQQYSEILARLDLSFVENVLIANCLFPTGCRYAKLTEVRAIRCNGFTDSLVQGLAQSAPVISKISLNGCMNVSIEGVWAFLEHWTSWSANSLNIVICSTSVSLPSLFERLRTYCVIARGESSPPVQDRSSEHKNVDGNATGASKTDSSSSDSLTLPRRVLEASSDPKDDDAATADLDRRKDTSPVVSGPRPNLDDVLSGTKSPPTNNESLKLVSSVSETVRNMAIVDDASPVPTNMTARLSEGSLSNPPSSSKSSEFDLSRGTPLAGSTAESHASTCGEARSRKSDLASLLAREKIQLACQLVHKVLPDKRDDSDSWKLVVWELAPRSQTGPATTSCSTARGKRLVIQDYPTTMVNPILGFIVGGKDNSEEDPMLNDKLAADVCSMGSDEPPTPPSTLPPEL